MIRLWVEVMAIITDIVPLPFLLLIMFLVATAVAVLWYTWPSWIPRHLPRFGARVRRRRRERDDDDHPIEPAEPIEPEDDDASDRLPDRRAGDLDALADRLASEGRYAEAVRERLRAIVRHLVETGALDHRPGWTVTELAGAAAAANAAIGSPLRGACDVFSEIWYGMRPATSQDDDHLRQVAAEVTGHNATTGGQR